MDERHSLRDRLRAQYIEIVTPKSGHPVVFVARPKTDVSEPLLFPLPLFVEIPWVAMRALRHVEDGRPWVVQTYPRWQQDKARTIAEASKWEAIERVRSEATALRTPKT